MGAKMVDIEQRVDRGACKLDVEVPGWHDIISLELLVMHNSVWCIIGQLFDGNFTRGRMALGIAANETDHYGFDAPSAFYQHLRKLWIREISLRKLLDSEVTYRHALLPAHS